MEFPIKNSSSGSNSVSLMNISRESRTGSWRMFSGSSDATLFSSSLPVLPHAKLNSNGSENCYESIDDIASGLNKPDEAADNFLEDVQTHEIGNLLPDDEDELLAGIMDDLDLNGLPGLLDELEDYDVFGSGGGMELETDPLDNNLRMSQYGFQNGVGTAYGEHPFGEHPSRTLFVRNINSNVEDSELKDLFQQYGDIRTLYTACKHRGFVMISYYDIRAARAAMRGLQNKLLRRRKLDIHFSIPKDNPSEKDINQGTLVIFNLDPSVSDGDLFQIFGAYGEVKEIRETPNKRHHKFIEFFDVRAAEAALKALNRSEIAGKRIKLEPSRPGGARRNLMLQFNQDLEPDDSHGHVHHVSLPLTSSSAGNWLNSSIEHSPLQSIGNSPVFKTLSPTTGDYLPGLASVLHSQGSDSAEVATSGNYQRRVGHFEHLLARNQNSGPGSVFQESHSLPEPKLSQYHHRSESLSGSQFLWEKANPYSESSSSSVWPTSSTVNPFSSGRNGHGFPFSGQQGSFQHYCNHHIGSASSGFFPKSPEPSSFMGPGIFGRIGVHSSMSSGITIPRNMPENDFRTLSSQRLSPPVFLGNGSYPRFATSATMEGFWEQGRCCRVKSNVNQVDSKKQFQLVLDKIISGEDTRTTLMIKNIPNKYTSKMLLAAIDEKNKGTYDFLYMPIDFKNKCNVGYAFINMLSPKHIILFYEAFNGKKWEKFNSEKVASLAYARIQGKTALVAHFQNSSLMNEDKRCRPILFDGPDSGDQLSGNPSESFKVEAFYDDVVSFPVHKS